MVEIGKWKEVLPFNVFDYGTHPIVGYLELKALRLLINCVVDSLMGEDGDRVLYNVVRMSRKSKEKEKNKGTKQRTIVGTCIVDKRCSKG